MSAPQVTLMPSDIGHGGGLLYRGTDVIGGATPSAVRPGMWAAWSHVADDNGHQQVRLFRDQEAAVRWVTLQARPVVWTVKRDGDPMFPWVARDQDGREWDRYREHHYAIAAATRRSRAQVAAA